MSVGRVGRHACGLGANHYVLVLVENGNGEWNGSEVRVDGFFRVREGKNEAVSRLQNGANGDPFAV